MLSDVWTTVGVLAGLALVWATDLVWLDPLAAIVVGVLLARAGLGLVREAAGALLDEEDPELTRKLTDAFEEAAPPGVINLHNLRALRIGSDVHIDAHAYVPEFWTVQQSHEAMTVLERGMLEECALTGELALHLDPCERSWCSECDLPDCPVRQEPFEGRRSLEPAEVAGPPEDLARS